MRLQADNINCHQFDGVHSVARSSLLGGRYRWAEVRTMCERFCRAASRYLTDGALTRLTTGRCPHSGLPSL